VHQTPRLQLRELEEDDLGELAAMFADPEQMRFYPRPRSPEETVEWLTRNRSFYDECGYGFWAIQDRDTSAFLGYCGIRPLVLGCEAVTEIGWHTKKAGWGKGTATEAATTVRDAAFARYAQAQIVALVTPDNLASRRVAEKVGMREVGTTALEGVLYLRYVCERNR
jgi:RimJ/RimL family protein N-acetyltransferase